MSTATVKDDRLTLTVVEDPAPEAGPEVPPELAEAPAEDVNAVRARDRAREYALRALRAIRPPDFWEQELPSLRHDWRHAIWGEHTTRGWSAARVVYVLLWCLLLGPATTVFTFAAWVHKRAARVVVFYGCLWALWQIPPVRAVLGFLGHWNVPVLTTHLLHIGG